METTKEQHLAGFKAADKIISRMVDEAQKDRPHSRVNRNSKGFCEGYFSGLVAAHAFMVLGQFPNIPENKAIIDQNT